MGNYGDYNSKVFWDKALDYIPGVSSGNSLKGIFQKNAYRGEDPNEFPLKEGRYVQHIQEKSWLRLIGCAIPGVNIICALFCDIYDALFSSKSKVAPQVSDPDTGVRVSKKPSMEPLDSESKITQDFFTVSSEIDFDLTDTDTRVVGSFLYLENETTEIKARIPLAFQNMLKERNLMVRFTLNPDEYITVEKDKDGMIRIELLPGYVSALNSKLPPPKEFINKVAEVRQGYPHIKEERITDEQNKRVVVQMKH